MRFSYLLVSEIFLQNHASHKHGGGEQNPPLAHHQVNHSNIGYNNKEKRRDETLNDGENMAYDKWINSYRNKNTRRIYGRGVMMFSEWLGKSVDDILNERNQDLIPIQGETPIQKKERTDRYERLLEQFWNDLVSGKFPPDAKPYKEDSASALCKGLLQLFRYYGIGFWLRNGSPIAEGFRYREKMRFPLKPEHVRKIFWKARDLKTQTWLSMANDLGWRIGDFLSIRVSELPSLDQIAPVEWFRVTQKERVVAKTCLSSDTVRLLSEYIKVFDLKGDDPLFDMDENTINRRLRELATECGIKTKPYSLSFHCFRDYIISNAKNQQIDPDTIKLMVGKQVKQDMLSYLSGLDVKQAFSRLQEVTRINGDILKRDQIDLLTQQGMMIQTIQTRIETLEKELTERHGYTQQQLNEIRDFMALVEEKFYVALREAKDSEMESLKDRLENLENAIKSMKKEEREINPSRR